MTRCLLLVGTPKGAFILESDAARRDWSVGTPTCDGWPIQDINVDRATNTQRVIVAIADTDTAALAAGIYKHALKRTDEGSETILSFGDLVLQKAAA